MTDMSLNASAPTNGTHPQTILAQLLLCMQTTASSYSFIAFALINIPFTFPLCAYVLYLGTLQWRQRARMSHTDVFTFNMAAVQLLGVVGSVFSCGGIYFRDTLLVTLGICMVTISTSVYVTFQILVCLERYVAVVHPVTYLRLKTKTRLRNMTCGLVWVLSSVQMFLTVSVKVTLQNLMMTYSALCLIIAAILFCNISVMCALIRPSPGDGARSNQSKRRAFHTITAILGTLVLKFGGDMFSSVCIISLQFDDNTRCGLWLSVFWFSLPSTLVLPILFLQRAGKLACCKTRTDHGLD